jgi:hypothetical protein
MDETEYSEVPQSDPPAPSLLGSIHLPVALIALALAINFFAEVRTAGKQAEIMRWQLSGLDRQTEMLSAGKRELAALISKNNEVVMQAQQIQGQYTNLFGELIDLAKDDKDAKEIVEKWGIKRSGQAVEAAPPAAAADAPKDDAAKKEEPKAGGAKAPTLR